MKKKAGLWMRHTRRFLLKLKNYRDFLEKLAKILLEKETIDGDELKQFAEEVRVRASATGEKP